ncbi:MAG: hypothetical protein KGK33_15920 [Hyphomicrobiales bacterium]|nr:hypothetical protein [Hyphomicrobiales bacterium]
MATLAGIVAPMVALKPAGVFWLSAPVDRSFHAIFCWVLESLMVSFGAGARLELCIGEAGAVDLGGAGAADAAETPASKAAAANAIVVCVFIAISILAISILVLG